MNQPATTPPAGRGGPAASPVKAGEYTLDLAALTPGTRFQDVFASYLQDRSMVQDPLAVAYAAVFVVEALGLAIVDPKAKNLR